MKILNITSLIVAAMICGMSVSARNPYPQDFTDHNIDEFCYWNRADGKLKI